MLKKTHLNRAIVFRFRFIHCVKMLHENLKKKSLTMILFPFLFRKAQVFYQFSNYVPNGFFHQLHNPLVSFFPSK